MNCISRSALEFHDHADQCIVDSEHGPGAETSERKIRQTGRGIEAVKNLKGGTLELIASSPHPNPSRRD